MHIASPGSDMSVVSQKPRGFILLLSVTWLQLSQELGFPLYPKSNLTFSKCLEMGLQDYIEPIAKVAEVAGKEYSIEQVCTSLSSEVEFEFRVVSMWHDEM